MKATVIGLFLVSLVACSILNSQRIVGTWEASYGLSGAGGSSTYTVQYIFEAGGGLSVGGVAGGAWSIDGDELTMTVPGGQPTVYTMDFIGDDALSLATLDGSSTLALTRV